MAYLTLELDEIDMNCAYLARPTPNTVLQRGEFRRLYYSNSNLTLSGIYLLINCKLTKDPIERSNMGYAVHCDKEWLPTIKDLETNLLGQVPDCKAKPRLHENLSGGILKFSERPPLKNVGKIIVKISGVWTTERECGLTYKLMPAC